MITRKRGKISICVKQDKVEEVRSKRDEYKKNLKAVYLPDDLKLSRRMKLAYYRAELIKMEAEVELTEYVIAELDYSIEEHPFCLSFTFDKKHLIAYWDGRSRRYVSDYGCLRIIKQD
jgi:hypothetical protein